MSNRTGQSGDEQGATLRDLAEAMAHPVRAKLLAAVSDKGEQGATIRQLAERTGEGKRKVRYHLDAMVDTGLVGIASERSKGGVVERFFRAKLVPWISDDPHQQLAEDQRRQIAIEIFKAVFADVTTAMRAGMVGARDEETLIRLSCEVDEHGWRELAAIQNASLLQMQAVLTKAKERMQVSGENPIVATTALLLFEVPPWPAP